MTTSRFPDITDELLSAYIDNAVTPSERALIEQAASEDATVAWRLATLRETVTLLQSLPMLNAPRAFALTPEMITQSRAEPAVSAGVLAQSGRSPQLPSRQPTVQAGWWARMVDGWRTLWTGGNPMWRNALATSMAALLVLLVLPALLSGNTRRDLAAAPPANLVNQESMAAPASSGVAEMAADSASTEPTINPAPKQVATADVGNNASSTAVALAPAQDSVNITDTSAPRAPGSADAAMAAPAEAEIVVAAVTLRAIPGERATEDALSGIANAEAAPAYAAAASAPVAPELPMTAMDSTAAEGAMLAAPVADESAAAPMTLASPELVAPATGVTIAAPTATAASIAISAPTATIMPTAAPTRAAVAEARPAARVIATAPASVAIAAPSPAAPNALLFILPWLQLAALAGAIVFGFLWWRSRRA